MPTNDLAIHTYMDASQQVITSLLQMACEAEQLGNFSQAEILYRRAYASSALCFGGRSAHSVSILWDLAKLCEKQNRASQAQQYYNLARTVPVADQSNHAAA